MRNSWLSLIAYNADKATWDKIHRMAKAETNKQARSALYRMLAGSRDAGLARTALDLALTSEPGPTDSPAMISEVAGSHPEMALDFVLANHARVEQLVDVASRSRYVARIASASTKRESIAKLEDYARRYLTADSRKPVNQAIAAIEAWLATDARSRPQLRDWYLAPGRR